MPPMSDLDDDLSGLIPLSTRNEALLKEVLESYLLEKYQPTAPSSSGSGRSRKSSGGVPEREPSRASKPGHGGKARREVIASLYMQRQQPRKKPSKADVLRLPPWENSGGVSYTMEEEALDRQEQVRQLYSVRNVGISVAAAAAAADTRPPSRPSSTPAGARRRPPPARPPISDDDISLDGILDRFPSPPSSRERRVPTAPTAPPAPTAPTAPTGPASSRSRFQRPVPPAAPASAPAAAPAAAAAAAKRAIHSTPSKAALSSPKRSVGQRQQLQLGSPLHTAGFLIAPPAQPEDVVGLCADIIMRVSDKLIRCFSEALEFADDHKEAIGAAQARREAATHGVHDAEHSSSSSSSSSELDTQPVVARILNRLGAQRDNQPRQRRRDTGEINSCDSDTEGDGRSVGTASAGAGLTRSQSSFKSAMELLICIPNHRPADELCTILLWVLSCGSAPSTPECDDRMHADILASKNMLAGFENHIYRITEILAQVSERDSQRSGAKMQAAADLRSWIVDRFQVIEETPGAAAASSSSGATSSAFTSAFASASSGAGFDAPVARKPQYNGPVKRLGREYKEYRELSGVEPSGADDEYPTLLLPQPVSPYSKPAAEDVPLPRGNTRKVRLHLGMYDFSTAMNWPDTPVLLEEGHAKGGARVPICDAVLPPLLAIHHEKPPFLSTLPLQTQTEGISGSGRPETLQRTERKRNMTGHADADEPTAQREPLYRGEHGAQEVSSATTAVEHAFAQSQQSSFSHFTSTFVPPTPVEREMAFFRLAPALTPGQRSLILNAFIVDLAQAVLLNVSVLCRHAWAGKHVTPADLLALFGEPIVRLIGKKTLAKLLEWLVANRRTDCSFKTGNPTLTDLALQRMFAYWPQLSIQLNPAPRARRPFVPKKRDKDKQKEEDEQEEVEEEKEEGVEEDEKAKEKDKDAEKEKDKGKKDKEKDKDSGAAARKSHSSDSRPNARPSSGKDKGGKEKGKEKDKEHGARSLQPHSRPSSRASSRAGSRPTTADASSSSISSRGGGMHAVITTYIWSDPYRVGRIFKEPHMFLPNVNGV